MSTIKELIGQRFGKIKVLSFSRIKNHNAMWTCYCDCGRIKEIKGSNLIRGTTKSCGCLKVLSNKKNKIKKWNPIIINDTDLKIPLTGDKYAIIDKEDLDKIKGYSWYFDKKNYARDRNGAMMHRIIMNCPYDKEIDHKDHDGLNNRKNNLRICTRSQNQENKLITKKNTSGFKGVSYKRSNKKYSASISYRNKHHHLGYFDSPEDAHHQYINVG